MADKHASRPADGFGAAAGWTVAATLVPSLGLWRTGHRKLAIGILAAFALVVVALVVLWNVRRETVLAMAVDPAALTVIGVLMLVLALGWVAVIVHTHLRLRPRPVPDKFRIIGALMAVVLTFAVAAPLAVGARYTTSQADMVTTVFGSNDPDVPKEWQDKGRLNVLLLGGDSGEGREGVRTDTVMVASIDTTTGDSVLFSLPRQTARMPFPEGPLREAYPNGWYDGWNPDNPEYLLNSMYAFVPTLNPELFPDTEHAGGEVMKASVGEALGLELDYYALLDMDGFERLINALGGVTVNINSYVAMGGSTDAGRPPARWLSPGPDQHLNGEDALWYARGRFGSDDFARMGRQQCVMSAVTNQASVPNLLARYEAVSREFQGVIKTDLPQDHLPSVLNLALLMREGNMRSVVFTNGKRGFSSANPDYELMAEQVQTAITESHEPPAPKSPSPKPSAPQTQVSTPVESTAPPQDPNSPSPSATPTTASDDVRDECAFDPVAAQEAIDNPPYWVN